MSSSLVPGSAASSNWLWMRCRRPELSLICRQAAGQDRLQCSSCEAGPRNELCGASHGEWPLHGVAPLFALKQRCGGTRTYFFHEIAVLLHPRDSKRGGLLAHSHHQDVERHLQGGGGGGCIGGVGVWAGGGWRQAKQCSCWPGKASTDGALPPSLPPSLPECAAPAPQPAPPIPLFARGAPQTWA